MLRAMRHDKKVSGGKITLILLKGIGQAFISARSRRRDAARLFAAIC